MSAAEPKAPPSLLRAVDPPLGLFFRPGRNDHTTLSTVLSMGAPSFSGVVMDASHAARQKDLRLQLAAERIESVLDPMALELATKGGWERPGLRQLPWAGDAQHHFGRLSAQASSELIGPIVRFCITNGYSSVLAPTHYLNDGSEDPWWHLDRRLVQELRRQLDASGQQSTPIYYRLAVPRATLMDPKQRASIVAGLRDVDIDAVWLCLHPVNARSGSSVLKSYIALCSDLAAIGVPLVAERTGFLGTALLGFNAVGGIESGITLGEGFNASRLLKPKPLKEGETPYARSPRVYLAPIGTFLDVDDARAFFTKPRMKTRFGCQDQRCCRTIEEMCSDPRRHLLFTRSAEVTRLSRIPAQNRPMLFLEAVRRASDDAVHAARVGKQFAKDRERLDGWRLALSGMLERDEQARVAAATPRGRLQHRKSA